MALHCLGYSLDSISSQPQGITHNLIWRPGAHGHSVHVDTWLLGNVNVIRITINYHYLITVTVSTPGACWSTRWAPPWGSCRSTCPGWPRNPAGSAGRTRTPAQMYIELNKIVHVILWAYDRLQNRDLISKVRQLLQMLYRNYYFMHGKDLLYMSHEIWQKRNAWSPGILARSGSWALPL